MGNASSLRRALATCVLALYSLVAGFVVPLHALHEASESLASSSAAPCGDEIAARGPSVEASCPGRDCGDPRHHHGERAHDPATCVSCAQARLAFDDAGVAVAAAPEPAPAGRAFVPPALASLESAPALHRARGPPVLS
jgi:hypothetical protein